ncbi:MAG: serpin family protein [Kiritimatiellia bacterium]
MNAISAAYRITFALLLAVAAHAAVPSLPPSVPVAVSNNTALACDLYAQLKSQEGNLFFSPYSVSTALAMTYAGARGETAAQMARTLHFTLSQADLHPAFAALSAQMNAVQQAGQVQLSIANSLWPHKSYPFLEEYLALVRKNYGTTITPVDFEKEEPKARAQINQWVEEKTQKKITNLIASPLDPLTRLVLVNAVYFKGKWESQFKADHTQQAPFFVAENKSVQAPLMSQTHEFKYGAWQNAQLIELPYAGTKLSMLVILPTEKTAQELTKVERALSVARLTEWRAQMRKQKVQLFLPKFKVTWGVHSLKNPLLALGMRDAFAEDKADFSGMDGKRDLLVSDVLHKAFIAVDEAGTEAAAATAVMMALRAVPAPPPVFRADHPFLFLIQENATGSILFLGRVTDPTVQ